MIVLNGIKLSIKTVITIKSMAIKMSRTGLYSMWI